MTALYRLRSEQLPCLLDDDDDQALGSAVCFSGHRVIAAADAAKLSEMLDHILPVLHAMGYRDFYCGGAIGFDTLAAEAVLRLRCTFPDTRLILALPCATQPDSWPESAQQLYRELMTRADEVHVLSQHYYNGCMQVRNRFMVDRSAQLVCFLQTMHGGTMATVAYAARKGLNILNLAMESTVDDLLKENP